MKDDTHTKSNTRSRKKERYISQQSKDATKSAGLTFVNDTGKGIERIRSGAGFRYRLPNGKQVRDAKVLERIRSLVIPPAWTSVWICLSSRGHIQATGRDARGRKQYLYHPRWREVRDEAKYNRLAQFGKVLPRIRRRVARDLKLKGLTREKVLATVIRLLETTLVRIGNEEYAKQNDSFGLTTMRDRHAKINGGTIHFTFKGKSGVKHAIDLADPALARIVRRCQDLPGEELLQYQDEKGRHIPIGSADVNRYLREITQLDFTAKDIRTWAGTVLAMNALKSSLKYESPTEANRNIVKAIETVAGRLGNTKAVCRKCYIHPAILECYTEGTFPKQFVKTNGNTPKRTAHLSMDENLVLTYLQQLGHKSHSRAAAAKSK